MKGITLQDNEITEETEDLETDLETTDETEETEDEQGTRKGSPEAAKWRVKLREAESVNASLSARVVALQTAEAARLATGPGLLIDGTELFHSAALEDVLDDDGNVDPAKVTEAVSTLVGTKPYLKSPKFVGDAGQGQRADAPDLSWADVIRSS